MAASDHAGDLTRRLEKGEISAAEAQALFREVMFRYLGGEISGPDAEALTGARFPAERRYRPLGKPDYSLDWEMLFETCNSDDERDRLQAIRLAMREEGPEAIDREAQITMVAAIRRAMASREVRRRARRRGRSATTDST
jgi:hypothetical protein